MSEMALTAEHLVVIGRGKLIADTSVTSFIAGSTHQFVRVRTPETDALTSALLGAGAAVVPGVDGSLSVTGLAAADIGDLAARHSVTLHELATQCGSLEEAFMELTAESVEFHGEATMHPAKTTAGAAR